MEYTRKITLKETADVIVVGGGPAGVCAAIAAARTGAKTVLLERGGCLGGIWTSGFLGWIIDYANKSGLLKEIIAKLYKRDSVPPCPRRSDVLPFEPEAMKFLLEELCLEAGVIIRYYSLFTDVLMTSARQIHGVVTDSKSNSELWCGKVFIDATGDGDLGARAGCDFQMGNGNGEMQPMSLLALVCGLELEEVKDCVMNYVSRDVAIRNLLGDLKKSRTIPSYNQPSLFHLGGSLYYYMTNHQYGCKGTDADDLTSATINGRREINRQIAALRKSGGKWRNLQLAATAAYIGVRESRRINGLYRVSVDDLKNGVRHDDGICCVNFCVDVHALDAAHGSIEEPPCRVIPYDIPLRALISADVDNLLMAGRCISGDFYAHASYRVTGNAAVSGEAAGVCAGVAAGKNIFPKDLSWNEFVTQYEKDNTTSIQKGREI